MSVKIPISSLSEDEKVKISDHLHLESVITRWIGQGRKRESKKSIAFFIADEKYVYVPFYYAYENLGYKEKGEFPNRGPKKTCGSFKMNKGFQLRDYQIEALTYAEEDFDARSTVFYNVYCSFGKTAVAIYQSSIFSQMTGTATLVLIPQQGIVQSWVGAFKKFSNAKVSLVGEETDDTQVIICPCFQAKKLKEKTRERVGFLIIDEADCYCTPEHVYSLLATQPYFIMACTATYSRDDGMEIILDNLVGRARIVKISQKPFFVLKIETSFTAKDVARTSYGTQHIDLVKKICFQEERNYLILDIIVNNLDEKILILTTLIEHATILYEMIDQYFEFLKSEGKKSYKVSRFFDSDDKSEDADVTICTFSKAGKGFDQESKTVGWDGRRFNLLILASSTLKIEQLAGRVFRSEIPVIIEFVDDHENIRRHWRGREDWYRSRNGIILDIDKIPCWKKIWKTEKIRKMYEDAKDYSCKSKFGDTVREYSQKDTSNSKKASKEEMFKTNKFIEEVERYYPNFK